jgi:HEAT repeat protein
MKKPAAHTGWIAAAVILGCATGYVILRHMQAPQPSSDSADVATRGQPEAEDAGKFSSHRLRKGTTSPAPREVSFWETNSASSAESSARPTPRAVSADRPPVQRVGSAAVAQDSLKRLSQIDLSRPLTRDQAAEANRMLRQLVEQGAAAVPTIREFLERNEDVSFDAAAGGEFVDFATLRLGLVGALGEIGGPEAIDASSQTLQNTTDPLEVALLTRSLEQLAPGQYRQQELTAASEALTQAMTGGWKGDVSPLFETLQAYGDAGVVPVLKQAVTQWNYYATMALAGLPDGAGIPALIELAQDPAIASLGNGDVALRPLAQVAVQYPTAAQALVNIARANQMPDSAWPTVIASVAGTYIQYGTQIFGSTAPSLNWSNTEINQRVALVDQLLSVTSNPGNRQALQNARASLLSRLTR